MKLHQPSYPDHAFEISEIITDNSTNNATNSVQTNEQDKQYHQSPYRWVIVALVSLSLVINNLANNAIIPIASKIANVYGLSSTYANVPIQLSFLVYSLMNFPASHFMDVKGLGFSFRMGNSLYVIGLFFIMFINYGYHWVVFGSILVALGQPFIMNSPAKVATFWFLNKNRGIATGAITAINIVSLGVGLVTPAVSVDQDVYGQQAMAQISGLYKKYFIFSAIVTVLVMLFMKGQPDKLPSRGAEEQKTDIFKSFQIIKKDKNLWTFFAAFILMYGTFLSFGSTSNMLFKPYGFQDTQIAIFALFLLVSGITGAIVYTLYIKKTMKYRRAIMIACISSIFFMILDAILMNKIPERIYIVTFFIMGLGFSFTPLVPVSYDLGCQISFPIGQAQIIGILNGGAMIFTFIITLSISAIVGFGTVLRSGTNMAIYITIATTGAILYSRVKMNLKRFNMQKQKQMQGKSSKSMKVSKQSDTATESTNQELKQMQLQQKQKNDKIHLIKQAASSTNKQNQYFQLQ